MACFTINSWTYNQIDFEQNCIYRFLNAYQDINRSSKQNENITLNVQILDSIYVKKISQQMH